MNCGLVFTFALAFASLNYTEGRKLCKLEDIKCMTKAAQAELEVLMPGVKGVCQPLDPLHLATIEGEYVSLKYKSLNTTITGMKDCLYSLLKVTPEESKYHIELVCPRLVVKYSYIASGLFGPLDINGKGSAVVTLDYYKIIFDGAYGQLISKKNKKLHFFVTSFIPSFESRGPVTVDINGSLHGDPVKHTLATDFLNKNEKNIELFLRSMVMGKFAESIIKAIDNYVRAYPAEDIFYE